MESTVLAYTLKPKYALTIDYGQICAESEIKASSKICEQFDIQHFIYTCNLKSLGFGELFGEKKSSLSGLLEWTPYRNQFLLTIASMYAIKVGVEKIIIGTVKDDESYSDGRSLFFEQFNALLKCQEGGIQVMTPGINLSSFEMIKSSGISINILRWGFSCTKHKYACGICRSCLKKQHILEKLETEQY